MDFVYTPFQVWVFVSLGLIALELVSPGFFYFFSLACGALGAGVFAYFGWSLATQLYGLCGVSVTALILLRQWVKRLPLDKNRETNVYGLIGKMASVTKNISPSSNGQVKIMGQTWVAQTLGQDIIEIGTSVIIKHVTGVRLIVGKIDKLDDRKDHHDF